jgi:hypothetical protein
VWCTGESIDITRRLYMRFDGKRLLHVYICALRGKRLLRLQGFSKSKLSRVA